MYDINYYDGMLRNYSGTAEYICRRRWEFVSQVKPRTVLDYGSGVGWFRAFAPSGVVCDTYDIMPVLQTGIQHDHYDLITFWDSLEHIPHEKYEHLFNLADAAAITIPIKPDNVSLQGWKHWKPKEHIFLPSRAELVELFWAFGFRLFDSNQDECPPRDDVWSFLFVRKDAAPKKIDPSKRPVPRRHPTTDYSNPGLTCEFSGPVRDRCTYTLSGDLGEQPLYYFCTGR